MFKYELKKLIIIEIIFLSIQYAPKEFANELTEKHYNNYMSELQGKLTDEKEKYISDEHEKITAAEADYVTVQTKMASGGYENENDYLADLVKLRPYQERADAFEMIYSDYKHVSKDAENRYMIPFGTEGMCRDYPDVPLLLFIVAMTSFYFLTEESSGMIVLLRSCESKKKNTFLSKLASLFILIFSSQILISVCEFAFLSNSIDKNILSYPVQSIEYFGNCAYNLNIFKTFILIQLLKLSGCLFIAMLTVLLAVISKKPIVTAALPLAICLIQQFAFSDVSKAYYFPTGLLRAVGYFRGDSYENRMDYTAMIQVNVFSAVPKEVLYGIIFFAFIFIFTVFLIGLNYYKSIKNRIKLRKTAAAAIMFCIMAVSLTGCGKSEANTDNFCYNMSKGNLQTEQFWYTVIDNGSDLVLTEINMSNGEQNAVIKDVFLKDMTINNFCLAGNKLYCCEQKSAEDFIIRSISLDDYTIETVAEQHTEPSYSFLGLERSNNIKLDTTLSGAFTDGQNLFILTFDGEIYQCDMGFNEYECIISDGVYRNNLIYDGKKIYYLNLNLELKSYDIQSGENVKLAGGFVKSIDLCGDDLFYSNSEGIFRLNLLSGQTEKLSDAQTDSISVDGEKIVFSSKGKLYLLTQGNAAEIYSGTFLTFVCLRGHDVVICDRVDPAEKRIVKFAIEI